MIVAQRDVSELAARALESVVVITFSGRDGKQEGLGSGFILTADGLIATNMHVIGEARPITVKLRDGRTFPVTKIEASDRHLDLAVLKIEATDLPAIALGDSDVAAQGNSVLALGNPQGLRNSVVAGLLSGKQEIEGQTMLQLAMPIEQGNSGGPLIDLDGKVLGIVTLKSLVTDNLGFAVPINALKPLLENPNPIAMDRWLTIGVLNPRDWKTLFGANWRQRAGRIRVDGTGAGFGGRSLALSNRSVPEIPYEVEVAVKLDDESGAAGLAFGAESDDRHFGFYPSAGSLRLTRFDGPDVFSWNVLEQIRTPAYRPGEWNTLKVRVEADRILCFVNGKRVSIYKDVRVGRGAAGLAKFRDTAAEFKGFRTGESLSSTLPDAEAAREIRERIDALDLSQPLPREARARVADLDASRELLERRARELEREAERLKALADDVDRETILAKINELLAKPEDETDLLHVALLIARIDNPDLDVRAYLDAVEQMAAEIRESLPEESTPEQRLAALDKFLFEELGYHGSRHDYYNSSNSYLNEVIDDREGLPITLSVLYIEMARRLELPIEGVGLPGHFIVRYAPKPGEASLIDPFHKGKRITRDEAAVMVRQNTGRPFDEQDLVAVSPRQIAERMLNNLFGIARNRERVEEMRRYIEALVVVAPEEDRYLWFRAVLNYQTDRHADALSDVDELLSRDSLSIDRGQVQQLKQVLLDTEP